MTVYGPVKSLAARKELSGVVADFIYRVYIADEENYQSEIDLMVEQGNRFHAAADQLREEAQANAPKQILRTKLAELETWINKFRRGVYVIEYRLGIRKTTDERIEYVRLANELIESEGSMEMVIDKWNSVIKERSDITIELGSIK